MKESCDTFISRFISYFDEALIPAADELPQQTENITILI
jgi:hypothetical protein